MMSASEQRAREILAEALEEEHQHGTARVVRAGDEWQGWVAPVLRAAVKAARRALEDEPPRAQEVRR